MEYRDSRVPKQFSRVSHCVAQLYITEKMYKGFLSFSLTLSR